MCLGSQMRPLLCFFFFFFNDTATTEIYTLSLHDALPIYTRVGKERSVLPTGDTAIPERALLPDEGWAGRQRGASQDRKSTRLNSSHLVISYAVFCLKKKKLDTVTGRKATDATVLIAIPRG